MAKRSSTIDLSSTRVITGIVPLRATFSVQLLSSDLSADTTLGLYYSNDKTNWDTAKESGTDVTDTLVDDTMLLLSFEADPELYWKIEFDGATTGNVAYIVNE